METYVLTLKRISTMFVAFGETRTVMGQEAEGASCKLELACRHKASGPYEMDFQRPGFSLTCSTLPYLN